MRSRGGILLSAVCALSVISGAGCVQERTPAPDRAGTGPFKFLPEQYVPGKTLVLEKNQDYRWGPPSYRDTGALYFGSGYDPDSSCQKTHLVYEHTGPAYLDQVIFRSIPDQPARAAALETGAVDAVDGLPAVEATRLEKMRRYWIAADGGTFHGASRKVNCLTYDTRGGSPVFYDAEFRWANSSPSGCDRSTQILPLTRARR